MTKLLDEQQGVFPPADLNFELAVGVSSGIVEEVLDEIPDDLKRNYVKRRIGDLTDVDRALKIRDFEELKRVGHKIRGNAASFSFPELEKLAIELEAAASSRDFLKAFEVGHNFRQWLLHQMCRPWFSTMTAGV